MRTNRAMTAAACAVATAMAIGMTAGMARAATVTIASDAANNYMPGTAPQGQNMGTGFGAFSLFVSDTSPGSGASGAFIATNRIGVFSEFRSAVLSRPFNAALLAGQTFTTDLTLNNASYGGDTSVGFSLRDSSGNALFTFFQQGSGGLQNGNVADAKGTTFGIGVPYDFQTAKTFAFTLNDATSYSLSVDGTNVRNGTINGTVQQVAYFSTNAGSNGSVDFSQLSVTAEVAAVPLPPAAAAGMALIAALGVTRLTRRRPTIAA